MGKRGLKICPECQTGNGPRAFNCKNCNYDFKPGHDRKPSQKVTGVGRGQKMCPKCQKTCGPRSYTCPHCQFEFIKSENAPKGTIEVKQKKSKSKRRVTDWESLEVGSRIKVLKGSGDYYLSKETGEKVYMQDPGVYKIEGVNEDGLVVHGKRGHGFIYMGQPKVSETLGSIQKCPASLVLLRSH